MKGKKIKYLMGTNNPSWKGGRVSVSCEICGDTFKIWPYEAKKGRKFCSRKCLNISNIETSKGENNPSWRGGLTKKTCAECGKVFLVKPSEVKYGRGILCSYKCSGKRRSKRIVGPNHPGWKGGLIVKQCFQCGKPFKVTRNRIPKVKFCSQKCYGIWKTNNLIGGKSHAWRGGLTPIGKIIRASALYQNWRKKIFIRDDYTCQKCGARSGVGKQVYIHAHHKKKFSFILSDIKQRFPLLSIRDIANNYPGLWDIRNGITLCLPCHKKEHKK